MGLNSLFFLIGECSRNIRRNGLMSLAALGTVTVALTVLGASLWTAHRIHEIAERQPHKFNQIDVFLGTDIPRDRTLAVQDRIGKLPGAGSIHLVTKEEAWGRLQTDEPNLTQAMPENPLPDKLEIQATDASQVDRLASMLRDKKQFPEVAQVNDASQEVRTMLGFARVINVLGGSAAIGLFIATLFIVHNTIRLTVFARRREIRIMQLVGATSGFIRFPLLLEGVIYGVLGAGIAAGIVLLCGHEVSRFVAELHSPLVGDVPTRVGPREVLGSLVVLGGSIGLVGGHLSLRRFLKQV
ncbi:MAG TPA: permease-like cell division protein FtsX [Chthonomonadaceae bacterium]|nr:permease-like cell division protein FtsX [Chthonomonadaceae bacterium]